MYRQMILSICGMVHSLLVEVLFKVLLDLLVLLVLPDLAVLLEAQVLLDLLVQTQQSLDLLVLPDLLVLLVLSLIHI